MAVYKFKAHDKGDIDAESEQGNAAYTLAHYARRHFLPPNNNKLESENPWYYKLAQQRFLIALLLLLASSVCAFLAVGFIRNAQYFEASALLMLMALNVVVLWAQLQAGLNWPVLLQTSAFLLFLYSYLLIVADKQDGQVLWALTMAPAFFFLLGYFWGLMTFFLAVLVTLAVLYFPVELLGRLGDGGLVSHYPIRERFLGVFVLLGVYSFLLEFDRSRIVGSLLKSRDYLRKQASTDELTGLANRHKMRECLHQQERRSIERKERYGLILADIDHFKLVNDQYGHDCGDQVITAVANALRDSLREEDVVARWGGEEFLVVLPDTDADNARVVASKLRQAVSTLAISYGKHTIYPTLSYGVVNGDHQQRVQDLIRQADHCLYQAKNNGRDCIVYA